MTLKERIKELCKSQKISMNQLEKELEFAVGYISKLDKSTPNSKYIQKLADYFNVSVDYLMTGKEPKLSVSNTEIDTDLVFLDRKIKEYALKMSKLSDAKLDAIFTLIDFYENKEG